MPGRKPRRVRSRVPLPSVAAQSRVVVMGADCSFAASLLRRLVALDIRPVAVGRIRPAAIHLPTAGFPAVVTHCAAGQFGRAAAIAGIAAQRLEPSDGSAIGRWLSSLAPHFIVLACYPRRLPPELAAMARSGCINVHPSLLPRYRGPEPLFAQFRAGERDTGVTLHLATPELDAGPILLQQAVPLEDGSNRAAAEHALAVGGADLLATVVRLWPTGRIRPRPQESGAATYAPWPGREATEIPPHWAARRAFNFLLATMTLRLPQRLYIAGHELEVERVAGFDAVRRLGVPVRQRGTDIEIQFSPGVLRLRARRVSSKSATPGSAAHFRAARAQHGAEIRTE